MKEYIIKALDDTNVKVEKQVPTKKKKYKSLSILDVKPIELLQFMQKNNIPDDAEFDGVENGYDGWDDIVLSWQIDVPTSEKDKNEYRMKRFEVISWKHVYDILISNGYKRLGGWNGSDFKQFKDTSLYQMYLDKDFDRLVKYYSYYFTKE